MVARPMTTELTDAQLVGRCRNGEAAAWNELVERFSRYVYAIRPWLAQLTRNACVDRLRATAREHPAEEPSAEAADAVLERLDEALDVHMGLESLSENCREILDRFFARDESYRAIGEALDLPAGTIASRISRCLGKLREKLEGRNSEPETSGGM